MATRADGFTFERSGESNRFIVDGFAVDYTGCGGESLADRSAAMVTVVVDQDRGKHHQHVVLTLSAEDADRLARALTVQAERARDQHAPIRERHVEEMMARVERTLGNA